MQKKTRDFQIGYGVGEAGFGVLEMGEGVGLIIGGFGELGLGIISSPESFGSSLVLVPSGFTIIVAGTTLASEGASDVVSGAQVLANVGDLSSGSGAARAEKWSENWRTASLDDALDTVAPGAKGIDSGSGKTIYTNQKTGKQVVVDNDGNYFRIEDTNLTGKRRYLDLDAGVPPNNKIVNGKESGRNQAEYNEFTHFNIE